MASVTVTIKGDTANTQTEIVLNEKAILAPGGMHGVMLDIEKHCREQMIAEIERKINANPVRSSIFYPSDISIRSK